MAASASRAIFCTQSNDFALGLPVVKALYQDDAPAMVSMLYLLAPVSLLLLNPIGFLLMGAYEPERPDGAATGSSVNRGLRVLGRVASTPLVACTFWGSCFNFASAGPRGGAFESVRSLAAKRVSDRRRRFGPDALPGPLDAFLETIGAGFTPGALFFTGLSLVGKVGRLAPDDLLVPSILSFAKCVALPVLIYVAVGFFGGNALERGFGFVYGAIPTAPSVLVYTHERGRGADGMGRRGDAAAARADGSRRRRSARGSDGPRRC